MSSPCLMQPAPVSQPRLREVQINLKSSREISSGTTALRPGSRSYGPGKDRDRGEAPLRVSMGSRSRSTPATQRAQRLEARRALRGDGLSAKPEPESQPERNGTLLHFSLPPGGTLQGLLPSSSSSSSSGTPRRKRPPPPRPSLSAAPLSSCSNSNSSSASSMRRARWLSYSTSNICFNSILDGRFRQLQGTGQA
ncbi:uncharacterized protein FYW47_009772 [Aplochiton taeniatus]